MDLIAQDGYSIRVDFSSCQGMMFVHALFLHRFLAHGVQKGLDAHAVIFILVIRIKLLIIYNIHNALYSLRGYASDIRYSVLCSYSGLRYSLVDLYYVLNITLMENILLVDHSIFIRY